MRTNLTLVPREPDATVHIVLNDFGPLGSAYVETDEAEAEEATIVENILSGQYSHPLRIVAFNTAEGWSQDVTEDIARRAKQSTQRTPLNRDSRAGVPGESARSGCADRRLRKLPSRSITARMLFGHRESERSEKRHRENRCTGISR
jgi:hypothetical protein